MFEFYHGRKEKRWSMEDEGPFFKGLYQPSIKDRLERRLEDRVVEPCVELGSIKNFKGDDPKIEDEGPFFKGLYRPSIKKIFEDMENEGPFYKDPDQPPISPNRRV